MPQLKSPAMYGYGDTSPTDPSLLILRKVCSGAAKRNSEATLPVSNQKNNTVTRIRIEVYTAKAAQF